jgi:hypothetical protein
MRASAAASHGVEPPLQPSEAVPSTSATLPAPAAMAIGESSGTSFAGSGAPFAPPASCTSTYWPGSTMTSGNGVSCPALAPRLPVPVALAYWSDLPLSDAAVSPRLKISM